MIYNRKFDNHRYDINDVNNIYKKAKYNQI